MNNSATEYSRITQIAEFLKSKSGGFNPEILAILGSGLGNYAQGKNVKKFCEIAYSDIPDFPVSTVSGHAGKFIFGYVEGIPVMFMQGRIHLYEGYGSQDVVLPIRAARLLGVKKLILTNAAGGVNLSYKPGDFMIISDHISTFVPSALTGGNLEQIGTRFPDMSEIYSKRMQDIAEKSVEKAGAVSHKGVYLQTTGPQYESPAEIRMFCKLGADAVGMSTAVEAIAACHAGMEICGISCITNMAAGILMNKLSHNEVKEIASKVENKFSMIMSDLIANF